VLNLEDAWGPRGLTFPAAASIERRGRHAAASKGIIFHWHYRYLHSFPDFIFCFLQVTLSLSYLPCLYLSMIQWHGS
jgi:hypothetical protein